MSTLKMSGAARQTLDGHKIINIGRMNAGEHKHNIVATADKTPKRGTTGAGDKFAKPYNGIGDPRQG